MRCGPRWRDGKHGEREKLISCYRTSLALAKEHGCETVAFPLISSGIYGYPKDQALKVAIDTISDFLLENDMTVYIVIFDRKAYQIGEKLFSDIAAYIDDNYVDAHTDNRASQRSPDADAFGGSKYVALQWRQARKSLDDALSQIDESFSEMLLRKIDEKGMTDAQCYKKANIDRKLFSKIRSDRLYKPSKPTALAFAIALELPLDETKEMLMKAGFALSHPTSLTSSLSISLSTGTTMSSRSMRLCSPLTRVCLERKGETMWLKLNLSGIRLSMQIRNYRRTSEEDWLSVWCKTDFSFFSRQVAQLL